MEEILLCPYCRCEFSVYSEDDQVVTATKCRCEDQSKNKSKIKPLDAALAQLEKKK
jgi:uncharacterized protein YbaR (Trm112 family)